MSRRIRFGTIYFHHAEDQDYAGPALARQLGASFVQLDTSNVCLWFQIHRAPDSYSWELLDRVYDLCEAEGIEPVPSLCHHFAPPRWVENGPFNDTMVAAPEYARFGTRFARLTALQKAFADFVTAFAARYGERTELCVLSHEWNLTHEMFKTPDASRNKKLLDNQMMCTLLAHKILSRRNPSVKVTYGIENLYRKDLNSGKRVSSYTDMIDAWPFSPRHMIREYVRTGDADLLKLLETSYVFHLGHSDSPEGFGTIYPDDSIGHALDELWRTEVVVEGQTFRYRDHIKEIIAAPFASSTWWMANADRRYSEEEQAECLENSIRAIFAAADRGIPVARILVTLNDKNEDWTEFSGERWIYVPEGIFKIRGFGDPLRHEPTPPNVVYEPKLAAETYRRLARRTP